MFMGVMVVNAENILTTSAVGSMAEFGTLETETNYITVCQSGCDFDSLDDALTNIEEENTSGLYFGDNAGVDTVAIDIKDNRTYKIGDHILLARVGIYTSIENNVINIDGEGSTIINYFGLGFLGEPYISKVQVYTLSKLNLKNLKIYSNWNAELFFYNIREFTLDNVEIINLAREFLAEAIENSEIAMESQSSMVGLRIVDCGKQTIKNSKIEGFTLGIVSDRFDDVPFTDFTATIDNSDLHNNFLSMEVDNERENDNLEYNIINSKLTSILAVNSTVNVDKSNKIVNDLTLYETDPNTGEEVVKDIIKRNVKSCTFEELAGSMDYNFLASNTMYLTTENGKINFTNEDSAMKGDTTKDLSELFPMDNTVEYSYAFDDNSIAKIVNGKIVGLKKGTTTLTVTDPNTNVTYRLTVNIDDVTNPNTSKSAIIVMLVFIISTSLLMTRFIKTAKEAR